MKNIIKNAIILTLITLIAGTALAFVYSITKEPIEKVEQQTTAQAYKAVFENADEFVELEINADEKTVRAVSKAVSKDEIKGYVMTSASKGYGGDIKIAIGIDLEGKITGVSVLDASKETPGLGAKVKEDKFISQFKDIKADKVEDGVDAISGATYSTNGVKNAVKASLEYFDKNLKEGE